MDVKTKTTPEGMTPDGNEDTTDQSWLSFVWFLVKLVIFVLLFRSFVFAPFSIPSESMLPRLWNGDYLLAAKWPYGFTKDSLAFSAPLIPGRIFASEPERGDIVIFKHPIDGTDYIKRVIGLPGDRIGMIGGQVMLNDQLVPKDQIDDLVFPVSTNLGCSNARYRVQDDSDGTNCSYPRYRETLPGGVTYEVLDDGLSNADQFEPIVVPENHMFVMGDNRDNSQDSRYPAMAGAGVGLVPQDNLVGEATIIMWSTDGSSQWYLPWTWFSAARWDRIGSTL